MLLVALLGACGGGGGDDSNPLRRTTPEPETGMEDSAALAPCGEDHHVVLLDVAGTLTLTDTPGQTGETMMWASWINGEGEPEVRPGAPEITHAYRARGYELIYSITVPPMVRIDGMAPPLAVEAWLQRNGFATGDGVRVLGYNGDSVDINVLVSSITEELIRLADEDVKVDLAYTDNDYRVYAFTAGGIPANQVFTLGPQAGVAGTAPIPDEDLQAHLPTVEARPPVCVTGA